MTGPSPARRLPPGGGLALGLVVGMAIGIGLGRLVELRALGFVFGLGLGIVLGLWFDNPRASPGSGHEDGHEDGPEDGAIARALLWVLLGLVVLVLAALAIAPELLEVPGQLSGLLLAILVAGVPGTVLLMAMIARRRRIDRAERSGDDADGEVGP